MRLYAMTWENFADRGIVIAVAPDLAAFEKKLQEPGYCADYMYDEFVNKLDGYPREWISDPKYPQHGIDADMLDIDIDIADPRVFRMEIS